MGVSISSFAMMHRTFVALATMQAPCGGLYNLKYLNDLVDYLHMQ